jgi:hypothetical protein
MNSEYLPEAAVSCTYKSPNFISKSHCPIRSIMISGFRREVDEKCAFLGY